jgi:uncharacterized membrane protein
MQQKYFRITLIILSLLGLATSAYLVYDHYNPNLEGSICDITAAVSCAVVNSGVYSTIVGIPVAIYGIAWFLISGFLSWNIFKKKNASKQLLGWNAAGLLFVLYFIYIEFLLKTVCPFCTVVHVLVALSLILSILLYKQFYKS